ncbi:hypothetical protein BH09VER1_BH09VER1_06620 [soil metagenome]
MQMKIYPEVLGDSSKFAPSDITDLFGKDDRYAGWLKRFQISREEQPQFKAFWEPESFEQILALCGFSTDVSAVLREAYAEIASDEVLRRLCLHAYCEVFLPERNDAAATGESFPKMPESCGLAVRLLYAVALLARAPELFAAHRSRRIPEEVTRATLADLPRWMMAYRAVHGVWGFSEVAWLRRHFQDQVVSLGRLQFELGSMDLPFRLFRHIEGGRVVGLAQSGLSCDVEGWPQTKTSAWSTSFSETTEAYEGFPVHPRLGHVYSRSIRLLKTQWTSLAAPGNPVLNIHIPKDGRLDFEACEEALRRAEEFFARHYPEHDFRGMLCTSWLMDRQLQDYLLATSNLSRFSNRFVPLPIPDGTDDQLIERVFGLVASDRKNLPQQTYLQRAVATHCQSGRKWRLASGFLPFSHRFGITVTERSSTSFDVCVPMPFQIVIDDVGWWRGEDGSQRQEPYRTGIARDHEPADYQAVVDLGRALNMRPLAGMILGEWDPDDRLRAVPSASWMGRRWHNFGRETRPFEEAAEIIRSHPKYFELGLHGIMHEFWNDGIFTRAEWHDTQGIMRPREEVLRRIDIFFELTEYYRFGQVPRACIPPAGMYCFGDEPGNFADILMSYGINSLFTCFKMLQFTKMPHHSWFGFENGLLAVDRTNDPFRWNTIAPEPTVLPDGPICSMHWPQILHSDPARNREVVERWVRILGQVDGKWERLLSRNTTEFLDQLVHYAVTTVSPTGSGLTVDATRFFAQPWAGMGDKVTVKMRTELPVTLLCDGARLTGRQHQAEGEKILMSFDIPISKSQPIQYLPIQYERSL